MNNNTFDFAVATENTSEHAYFFNSDGENGERNKTKGGRRQAETGDATEKDLWICLAVVNHDDTLRICSMHFAYTQKPLEVTSWLCTGEAMSHIL